MSSHWFSPYWKIVRPSPGKTPGDNPSTITLLWCSASIGGFPFQVKLFQQAATLSATIKNQPQKWLVSLNISGREAGICPPDLILPKHDPTICNYLKINNYLVSLNFLLAGFGSFWMFSDSFGMECPRKSPNPPYFRPAIFFKCFSLSPLGCVHN